VCTSGVSTLIPFDGKKRIRGMPTLGQEDGARKAENTSLVQQAKEKDVPAQIRTAT
jgi:hypothetical protein